MTEAARIGRRIKRLREQSALTQEQVANELFISQSYLRLIEHGKANPTVNMVAKITSFLEAKVEENTRKEVIGCEPGEPLSLPDGSIR